MKLKTTINGKQSTVIGTPAEVAEFLEVARKKAIRRAVDALPRTGVQKAADAFNVTNTEDTRKVAETIAKAANPTFKPTFNAISQTREEIVKEAIADVAELLSTSYVQTSGGLGEVVGKHVGSTVVFGKWSSDRVDFFVSRTKRKVVAKLWLAASTGKANQQSYATSGIARCAPSDVFNEHVGKAIALRRALGLPVPTKYYEVGGIAPEGKQVGDVVEFSEGDVLYRNELVGGYGNAGHPRSGKTGVHSFNARVAKVIDDSARYVAPSTPAAKVVYVD